MIMDAVVERFVKESPITLIARLALQRALEPAWIDALESGRNRGLRFSFMHPS